MLGRYEPLTPLPLCRNGIIAETGGEANQEQRHFREKPLFCRREAEERCFFVARNRHRSRQFLILTGKQNLLYNYRLFFAQLFEA